MTGLFNVGLQLPCVIRLRQYRRLPSRIQTLSRKNILIRDGHICQYCGEKFLSGELELEHAIPRAQGGLSTWENLVAACRDCNARKGDRTLAEAGMKLLRRAMVRQVEETRWAIQVHRTNNPRAASVDFARRIMQSLDSERRRTQEP